MSDPAARARTGPRGSRWQAGALASRCAAPARRRLVLAGLLAPLPALSVGCASARELAPGQVWSYQTRRGEGASTLTIQRMERDTPLGEVVFISVRALNVRRPGRTLQTTEIAPLAFSVASLRPSLTEFQWTEPVSSRYDAYYERWWEAVRAGQGAAWTFTGSVKDAIDAIERGDAGQRGGEFLEVRAGPTPRA